jgi:hypothetical protein
MRVQVLFVLLFVFFQSTLLTAQCTDSYLKVLGGPSSNERGYAIAASPTTKVVYVSATKADSLIIIKLDSVGQLVWTRRLEIEANRAEFVNGMILDAEGKLAITGTIGSIDQQGHFFVCRYDPEANLMLWAERLISHSEGFASGISEMGPGGDYLVYNNPTGPNDAEVLLIDKTTGSINTDFAAHYHYEGPETISDMILHNGALYGIGRFTEGNQNSGMRTSIFSLNPANGSVLWSKHGHKSSNARLYGIDMVIAGSSIYGLTFGDDNGESIDNTEMFIQKLDLEGNVDWVKRYDLPGTNDWVDEIIEFEGGLITMARNRVTPSDIILIKTDYDGNVLWSKQYDFSMNDNSVTLGGITSQLTSLNGYLYFTAFADNGSMTDILLVRTDREGNISGDCQNVKPVNIIVTDVINPVFYDAAPTVTKYIPQRISLPVNEGVDINIVEKLECGNPVALQTEIIETICEGESLEGYSQSGTYQDEFVTANGCDSIRTLILTVEVCEVDCGEVTSSSVYGSGGVDEHGRCIVRSDIENAVYIVGNREQNTLLVKMEFDGSIVWTREFDIVPNDDEIPAGLIEDTDGMLVISGTGRDYNGGSVYAFRYDPKTDQVLWAREYQTTNRDYNFGVIEKLSNGNFILNNQPTFPSVHDAQVMEVDRTTGNFVFAKDYRIIGTETLYELVYHDNAIYGVGRYKDGGTNNRMRHTLVKLDQTTFEQQWVKLGFRPQAMDARLYGGDMVIHNNHITSLMHGDPTGTDLSNGKVYIQQTSLDGTLIWLRQYDVPGSSEFSHELLTVGDGYIALVYSDVEDFHYLIKINDVGQVLWSRKYTFDGVSEPAKEERGNQMMIAAGSQLMFTGGVFNSLGDEDMLIIRTDLEGNIVSPCGQSEEVVIQSFAVDNPTWYDKEVPETEMTPSVTARAAVSTDLDLPPNAACVITDTLMSELEITICQGQLFEGYSEPGIYQDTFITNEGCDSIRVLTLTITPPIVATISREICAGESFMGFTETGVYVDTFALPDGCDSIRTLRLTVFTCEPIVSYDLNDCRSYMSDGSIMDYSEFTPEYIGSLNCGEVAATILFRDPPAENKHSCTEGLNGTVAMCISALSTCTYLPGDDASAVFEVTFTPDQDSVIVFNKLEFYEKAPSTYSWIDGPNGPNNYPRFYGIRILKDGVEIFEHHDINTSLTWALQSHAFNNIPEFVITEAATFRIELLPYCPIGNGALVSAWDLEDIRIFASCAPDNEEGLMINGTAATWNETPVYEASIVLTKTPVFGGAQETGTASTGYYRFTDVARYHSYNVKAEKNSNLLQGVNTIDIITLQKHLLGKRPFIALDQYIAGDINHDGIVNAIDMIQLRKALLGIIDEFPNNTSWRFAVQPVDLHSRDMSDFIEKAYIESLGEPTTIDWLGVKIGDVNRDAGQYINNGNIVVRSANPYALSVENATIQADEIKTIEFRTDDHIIMEGLQLAIELHNFEIIEVQAGSIPINHEHYNVDANGLLRISWSKDAAIVTAPGEVVFSITVRSKIKQSIADRVRITTILAPEAYTTDEIRPVTLSVSGTSQASVNALQDIVVMPNPFASSFVVNFNAPAEGKVSIVVFTTLGEQVYQHEAKYESGSSQHLVNLDHVKGSMRVLFCQLTYGGTSQTMKVVKQE